MLQNANKVGYLVEITNIYIYINYYIYINVLCNVNNIEFILCLTQILRLIDNCLHSVSNISGQIEQQLVYRRV